MADLSPSFVKQLFWPKADTLHHQTEYEISMMEQTAAELAIDIVLHSSGFREQCAPVNIHAPTMRRCVQEMLNKHEILFNGMVNKLNINRENVSLTFQNVVNEMFRDGEINWGRVVSVYAFAARLAVHLTPHNNDNDMNMLQEIAGLCGTYVAYNLGDWIKQQGGWISFDKYFPDQDQVEKTVWQGLLVTAALGLGALATMVAVR